MGLTQRLGTIPLAIQTDSSNNVGIGGAANASYKLAVTGASLFSSSINSGQIQATAGGAGIQLIGQAGSNAYYVNDQAANSGKRWRFGHTGAVSGYNSFDFYNQTDDRLVMTLASSGNVGIGTSSPSSRLHIYQAVNYNVLNDQLVLQGGISGGNAANPAYYGGIRFTTGDYDWGAIRAIQNSPAASWANRMAFYTMNGNGGALVERMSISNDGNVSIATDLYIGGQGYKPGGGSWANSSDIRLKENVKTIENALDKVLQLRGVTFDWKEGYTENGKKESGGFIADEVMEIFPDWVTETNATDAQKEIVNNDKIKSLSLPFSFDALLVEAIKELSAKVTALENK